MVAQTAGRVLMPEPSVDVSQAAPPMQSVLSRAASEGGFALASLAAMLLAHCAALFPHEYAHSFMAYALGYKSNPCIIHLGGTSLANLVLLTEANEHVDYAPIFAAGAGWAVALIGFAGPGIGNGAMYILSLLLLRMRRVRESTALLMLVFWFNLMNAGNFYDYVPIRTFARNGDMGHITEGLGMPEWLALILFGIPTAVALWWLFGHTLPLALARLAPHSAFRRGLIVTLSVLVVFGFFGLAGWRGYGASSHALSLASLALIPVMLAACWSERRWMLRRWQGVRDAPAKR